MPATLPKYSVGDTVYLRESAAIGRLEPVRVNGITLGPTGEWLYATAVPGAQPRAPAIYGDRINLITGAIILYTESEFVVLCDAYELAEGNLKHMLNNLTTQRLAFCPGSAEPTGATEFGF